MGGAGRGEERGGGAGAGRTTGAGPALTEVSSGSDRPALRRCSGKGRTLSAVTACPAAGNSRRSVTAACSPTAGL